MTEPVDPGAPTPPNPGSGGMASAAGLMDRLDPAARLIVGGSVGAIAILLIGSVVGAWSLGGYALVILGAATVALVIGYLASMTAVAEGWPVPRRDLVLAAGSVMSIIAVLNLIEVLFDLDQIDDERGGIAGLVLTLLLVAAAIAVLIGAIRARPVTQLAGSTVRRGERGARIALGGLALDLIAWLVMLTISVYALGTSSSFGIAASVLAVLVLVLAADPGSGWRLPIPAAWIAVGLAIVGTLTLLDQFGQYNDVNEQFGLDVIDSLAFFAHAIGTLLILGGAVLAAADHQRSAGSSTSATTGP
jgi:hypothetical protein